MSLYHVGTGISKTAFLARATAGFTFAIGLLFAIEARAANVLTNPGFETTIVCHLQVQTNSLAGGNWSDLASTTNPVIITPSQNNACVFYRLESP